MAGWPPDATEGADVMADGECVAAAPVGLTPNPPNPTAKATAAIPPNTATAVLICALIGRSFLS
ncbi:hypothetical protein BRW65_09655 [Mycobacterium paraffinicum]|uniref:Uncharacterized protein n=1 Tax=Mycobacterium paraffinicum TaxID=53378 RepID=A0A1Q4HWN9_9MYCO|nr:hypothetical protein BRW65_09655 [Mycobacterium paraffinicum]